MSCDFHTLKKRRYGLWNTKYVSDQRSSTIRHVAEKHPRTMISLDACMMLLRQGEAEKVLGSLLFHRCKPDVVLFVFSNMDRVWRAFNVIFRGPVYTRQHGVVFLSDGVRRECVCVCVCFCLPLRGVMLFVCLTFRYRSHKESGRMLSRWVYVNLVPVLFFEFRLDV